jgi:hypothetical protein
VIAKRLIRLSRLFSVDDVSALGSSRRVEVGNFVDVSYIHATSIINNIQNNDLLMMT